MALTPVKKEAVKKEALLEQWLRPALQRLGTLPDAEWRHLVGQVEVAQLSKGAELSSAGEVADRFALVASGVICKRHLTVSGKSVVRGFGGPGEWVGAYASLLTGQGSHLSVEALQPSVLLVVRWRLMLELYERHACWNTIGRRMAEAMVLEREARAHALLTRSARERYVDFCETHRALLPQLRQGDIASYLGISPVSLSRLKASADASSRAIAKGERLREAADTGDT